MTLSVTQTTQVPNGNMTDKKRICGTMERISHAQPNQGMLPSWHLAEHMEYKPQITQ